MYDDYYRRGAGIFGAFLLGAVVGAVLGLLFSPRSGKENRELIASKAQDYWGEAGEFYESGKAKVVDMYGQASDYAGQTAEQMQAKIDAARDKLKEQVGKTGEKVAEGAKAAKGSVDTAAEKVKAGADVAAEKTKSGLDYVAEKAASSKGGGEPAEPAPEA